MNLLPDGAFESTLIHVQICHLAVLLFFTGLNIAPHHDEVFI